MKNQKKILHGCLLLMLCACSLLACNSSTNQGGKVLTEQDVKNYFTNYHMKDCNEFYDCKVVFETPVQIGAPERRSIAGALPPPDGGLSIAYPVQVDVSFYKRDKDSGGIGVWTRYKGGIHYFFLDANSIWSDAPAGVDMTFENEAH